MTWIREDDRETLDARIGNLNNEEYRALHALRQFIGRETDSRDTGIFHAADRVHAVYATPKGPRVVTPKTLAKLHELDLIRTRDDYTDEDLEELKIEWPEGEGYYRLHKWEKYNPPRDNTATERKRRQRARDANGNTKRDVTDESRRDTTVTVTQRHAVTDRDSHGPRARAHAGTCAQNDHDHVYENEEQEPSSVVESASRQADDDDAENELNGSSPDEDIDLDAILPKLKEM